MSVVLQNPSLRSPHPPTTSPRQRVRQRGFTLIEILIVIAIAAGILFGIFTVANRIGERSAINEFASNMNVLAAETSAAFRAQGNFAGVSVAALLGMGAPPVTMRGAGTPPTTIVSPWGTVGVQVETIASPNDGVRFTVNAVPAAACSSLVTAAEGAFSRVLIGGSAVKNMTSVAAPVPVSGIMAPLNAAQVGTLCAGAGTGTHTIHFIMTR